MKIVVNDKDTNISAEEKTVILEKFGDIPVILSRFNPEDKLINIRVEKGSRWGYKISFSLWLPRKKHILAEVKGKDFKGAVNELKDLVMRQITDYKEILSENIVDKDELIRKLK